MFQDYVGKILNCPLSEDPMSIVSVMCQYLSEVAGIARGVHGCQVADVVCSFTSGLGS